MNHPLNPEAMESGNIFEIGRSLPHSEESEQCLIGSMLLSPSIIPTIANKLGESRPNHGSEVFYNHTMLTIYEVLIGMMLKKQPIDISTVTTRLTELHRLEEVGGAANVVRLSNFTPTASGAEWYADIIEKKYVQRQVIEAGTQIVSNAYGASIEDVEKLLSESFSLIASLNNRGQQCLNVKQLIKNVMPQIEDLVMSDCHLTGLDTGLKEANAITLGLRKSEVIVIAGRPSTGKTSLVTCIADHVASTQGAVLFQTLEMSDQQLVYRVLASRSSVNFNSVWYMNQEQKRQALTSIGESAMRLADKPLWIDGRSDRTPSQIASQARVMKAKHDLQLLIVDYIGLIEPDHAQRNRNRQQEVASISKSLKSIAKELQIPVILLCQLNREVESADRRPRLSDLRESGAIEQDADVVGLISGYLEDDELPRVRQGLLTSEDRERVVLLDIAKNRNGPQGHAYLGFDKEYTRYRNIEWPKRDGSRRKDDEPEEHETPRMPFND